MNRIFLILFLNFSYALLFGQSLPQIVYEGDFNIGKTIKIKSDVLGEIRELNVYLPFGYSKNNKEAYPVIYLLDGSEDEDFIHISGIVQFGSFSWINMVPESIVVGIGNVDRKRDFTYPSENELDLQDFPTSGKSAKFIEFIESELQPFINANFRTKRVYTIIGQSLGGLLATEILLKKPDLFDHYIIVSPSLWWDDEQLLNLQPYISQNPKSIYIAVGKEGEIMETTAKTLYTKLEKGENKSGNLFFEFLEDKEHGDVLHQAVYNALRKFSQITR